MDIVTLAMAKPKIVDLTHFKATNGYSFNDLLLSMMQSSMTDDGELKEMVVEDANLALRNALSTERQVVVEIVTGNLIARIPVTVTRDGESGICNQINASMLTYLNGAIVEAKMNIQYRSDTSSPSVALFVKAEVIGTSTFS